MLAVWLCHISYEGYFLKSVLSPLFLRHESKPIFLQISVEAHQVTGQDF